MRKPTLYMAIGPSGSGKSTFAAALQSLDPNLILVSTDAKRQALFGTEETQKQSALVFQLCERDAADALNWGCDVVFDATNTTAKGRAHVLDSIRTRAGVPFSTAALLFLPSVESAIANNAKRTRHVPVSVIERQFRQLWEDASAIPDQFDSVYVIEKED